MKNLSRITGRVLVLFFAFALSTTVKATPISIDFSAALDSSGPKPPGINTGDMVSGSISYDLDLLASQYNDADNGVYFFLPGASSFEFSVGGFNRSAELSSIQISNSFVDEILFWVDLPGTSLADEQWSLTLRDVSSTAWNTTFLETIAISTLTDLSLFSDQTNDINLFSFQDALPGPGHPRLSGEILTLSGAQSTVPEPAPMALLSFGLATVLMVQRRKKRI